MGSGCGIRILSILIALNWIFCDETYIPYEHDVSQHIDINEMNHSSHIYNLAAKLIYNSEKDMPQFLVSWDVESPETAIIAVTPLHTEGDCHGPDFQEDVDDSEVLVPTDNDTDFRLEANCTYDIQVTDSVGHTSRIKHTVPICVDDKCDCNKTPKVIPNITLEHDRGSAFLLRWALSDYDANFVKNVTFISYIRNDSCKNAPSRHETFEPEHEFLTNNSALIYSIDVEELCLLINFTNTFNCYDLYRRSLVIKERDFTWMNIWTTMILVILLLIIIAFWYIDKCRGTIKAILISRVLSRRRRGSMPNIYSSVTNRPKRMETNVMYIEQEIVDGLTDTFEFPRSHLKLLHEIGKGAFGEVFLGTAIIGNKEVRVAVKTLREKSSNEEVEDFLAEIDIMKKIGRHPNIVTMLRSCTLQEPYMMIMEYLPFGDLKHYLVNLREKWNNRRNAMGNYSSGSDSYITPNSGAPNSPGAKKPKTSTSTDYTNLSATPTSLDKFVFELEEVLDHTELQNFALQIACGMAHLETIPITHRDLAARNILIDERKVLKISDFGLSRPGPYINKSRNKLPLRWMALEAIEDHLYDNKSDVWSFGIVLWEIGTLGAFPYDDIPDAMLIYCLQMGKRLPRPEVCTDELYTLMLRCWSTDPKLRPTFAELVQQLDVTKSRIYIDFTQLNPTYVFPPTKSQRKEAMKQDQTHAPKYLECP